MDFKKKWFLIQAFKASLGTSLAAVGYLYLNIPNGYWTVIVAAWMLSSEHFMSSPRLCLTHSFQRFLGAIVGASCGLLVLPLVHHYLLLSVPVVFILIFLSFTVFEGRWKLKMVGTTAVIIMLISAHYQEPWDLAAYRCLAIFTGCLIAFVVTACIFPFSMKSYLLQEVESVLRKQFEQLQLSCRGGFELPTGFLDQDDFFELAKKLRVAQAILTKEKNGLDGDFMQWLMPYLKNIYQINQHVPVVALGLTGFVNKNNPWFDEEMVRLVYNLFRLLFSGACCRVNQSDINFDVGVISNQMIRFKLWCSKALDAKHYQDTCHHHDWVNFVFSLSKLINLLLSVNGLDYLEE